MDSTRKTDRALVAALSCVSAIAAGFLARRLLAARRRKAAQWGRQEPPLATPAWPVLGNALAYKADPVGFLERQRREVGATFSLDLAGMRMAVVTQRHEMQQVAMASEAVLSAPAATADFGFGETLGSFNVYFGTDLTRTVLKSTGLGAMDAQARATLAAAVGVAVREALPGRQGRIRDLLYTVRRASLHAVVLHLLGSGTLNSYNGAGRSGRDFLSEFMAFQDHVEDATAKGVALPSCLSRIFVWGPVRWRRQGLQRRLAKAVASAWSDGSCELGVWLDAVRRIEARGSIPAWGRYLRGPRAARGAASMAGEPVRPEEAAELAIGLLFAAHKNPAIGAAQTMLLLLEHPSLYEEVLQEVRGASQPHGPGQGELHRSVMETLRLTAHTIGGIRKVVAPGGFELDAADGRQFHIPFGRYIVLSHSVPNRDPAMFADPLRFDPSRFESSCRSYDEYEFTTFSQGLHRCPGRLYAQSLMETILSNMLQQFEFAPVGHVPPMDHERATLAQRAGTCSVEYQAVK